MSKISILQNLVLIISLITTYIDAYSHWNGQVDMTVMSSILVKYLLQHHLLY